MKPYLIAATTMYASNSLTVDLRKFVHQLIDDPPEFVDSAEAMEDQVNEWLGENAHRYRRCRPGGIVQLIRPYNPNDLPNYEGYNALSIYYESLDRLNLNPVEFIGFAQWDDTMQTIHQQILDEASQATSMADLTLVYEKFNYLKKKMPLVIVQVLYGKLGKRLADLSFPHSHTLI